MKNRNTLKTALVSLSVALSLLGFTACTRHHSPEKRAEWMTEKISGELKLTEEQKTKLNALKQEFIALRKEHHADKSSHLNKVESLIMSEKLDQAQAKALLEEKQKSMNTGFDRVFPKLADFHSSLTPEQKQKAVQMLEKFSKRWE